MKLNLGSTFKDFLNALNTNTEDTEGIINGEKTIKKLKLGDTSAIEETEETDEFGSVKVISQIGDGYTLRTGVVNELGVTHKETGMTSLAGRLSVFSKQEKHDSNGLLTNKQSATIGVNELGTVYLISEDQVKNKTAEIRLAEGKIIFNATHGIEGLSSGGSGGTLAIEVEELPTENIDNSKIYILNEIKNAEVYYFDGTKYCTIPSVVLDIVGVTPAINHYVVNELPTNAEITDLQTFSVINCYIFNDVAYVYGNAGAGNMWLTVSAIFAQMGNPTEDKGRVYDLADTSVEIGLYAYYEEFSKFYVYSENEWKEISDSTSDKYILRLSGYNGVLSDEQYQSLVDNFSNTTIIYTLGNDTIVFNAIATMVGLYISIFQIGLDITVLAIAPDKNWVVYTEDLSEDFIHRTGTNDIWANNTFNATNTFSETSDVEFKGTVDFTNATVIGLSGSGLTQEEVQEMINTAINGALEGSY